MHEVKAILLVGGTGTRLRSVLPFKPKVLAPIGEKTFLDLIILQLQLQGIRRVVMCTGYLAEQIESRFGDGRIWDVSIEYSKEEEPLGTAGAIKRALCHLGNIPEFLVLNGDSFLDINFHDLIAFHRSHAGAVVTVAVVRVEDAGRYGTVRLDASDRITNFAEKTGSHLPGLVNGGVYVFSQAVWQHLPEGPASLESDVLPWLCEHGVYGPGVYGKEQRGMFIDIGTPADYARAQQLLLVRSL
jgi:NDP-sugar pyrophosphorylase family protein